MIKIVNVITTKLVFIPYKGCAKSNLGRIYLPKPIFDHFRLIPLRFFVVLKIHHKHIHDFEQNRECHSRFTHNRECIHDLGDSRL